MDYLNNLMLNSGDDNTHRNRHMEYNEWTTIIHTQKGGNSNVPHGGFPPIIPIKKDKISEEPTHKKEREYASHKGSVSIKKIMENKKNIGRFIKTYV